jgi:hypothetical protein
MDACSSQSKGWQTKVGALNSLKTLAGRAPRQIAKCLPHIVPQVTQCFADAKTQVRTARAAVQMRPKIKWRK